MWTVVPHLLDHPHVIEARRASDLTHGSAVARFVKMSDEHFTKREQKDLPILNLRLGETEEVIAYKAKRRPAVVVAMNATTIGDQKVAHHEENRCVVVPAYGLQSEDDPSGFSGVMATRVRHLVYRQYFPFGEWQERRTRADCPNGSSLTEGIIRLDRLQLVSPSPPGCMLVAVKIANEPFKLLQAWLWSYLHAAKDTGVWEDLESLRELFSESMPDEARPRTRG